MKKITRKSKSTVFSSGIALAALLLVVLGCFNSKPSEQPSGFSSKSKEISDLLDEEKYEAAGFLLKSYIPQSPNDAGLYCQYVRFLVNGYRIEDNPRLSTPLFPPNGEATALEIISESSRIAVQFAPENKEWIAETILSTLYLQAKKLADSGEGFIYYNPGLIRAAWTAIEISPETGKKWSAKYKALIPLFAKSRKVSSTMYIGNLAGDLAGGKNNSGQDFIEATKAFKLVVEEASIEQNSLRDAWFLYLGLFEPNCKEALEKRNADYLSLLKTIKSKGYKPEEFINSDYLPADLRAVPTPTPTPFSTPIPFPAIANTASTPAPMPTSTPDSKIYLRVATETLNLRSETNLDNEPLLEMTSGDRLYLLAPTDCRNCAKDGKWFRVRHLTTAKEGWISNEFRGNKTFEFE